VAAVSKMVRAIRLPADAYRGIAIWTQRDTWNAVLCRCQLSLIADNQAKCHIQLARTWRQGKTGTMVCSFRI